MPKNQQADKTAVAEADPRQDAESASKPKAASTEEDRYVAPPRSTKPLPPWCRTCCTAHEVGGDCPGELLATGPERHGWRVLAETPRGLRVYGALVAPAGDRWRARIITYPRILWIIPRGGSMKFVGSEPQHAEERAIEYIKNHCVARGYKMKKHVPVVESGKVDLEQDERTAASSAVQASQRQLCSITVRYGAERPTRLAETDNLSEGGLFIRSTSPLPEGTTIKINFEVGGFGIPLRGIVQWFRAKEKTGRPAGLGVRLIAPHQRYIDYVRKSAEKSGDSEPEEETG